MLRFLFIFILSNMIRKNLNNQNDKSQEELQKKNFSISQRIENEPKEEVSEHHLIPVPDFREISEGEDVAPELAKWLLEFFGEDIFTHLKNNPNFVIPFVEEANSLQIWTENALKMLLPFYDIQRAMIQVHENYFTLIRELSQRRQKTKALESELQVQKEQQQKYQEHLHQKDNENTRLQKQLKSSFELGVALDFILEDDIPEIEIIRSLLQEDLLSPPSDLARFSLAFVKRWKKMKITLAKLGENENENLEALYLELSKLLKDISGLYIPQRSTILEQIAKLCSRRLKQYIFISPEESRTVDPAIHNANALGSSEIVEGISFAVIRSDTRQTVRYADVTVKS